jgi:hypothetical protein
MKPGVKPARAAPDPETQLQGFIAKFDAKNQALIRALRKALRKRMPTANELVWDNYNFFVLSYGATERPSDCIVTIAAAANGVGLSFYRGATLPDPHKLLLGSGTQNRFIRLPSADVLARPEVEALIAAAIAQAPKPTGGGRQTEADYPLSVGQAAAAPQIVAASFCPCHLSAAKDVFWRSQRVRGCSRTPTQVFARNLSSPQNPKFPRIWFIRM